MAVDITELRCQNSLWAPDLVNNPLITTFTYGASSVQVGTATKLSPTSTPNKSAASMGMIASTIGGVPASCCGLLVGILPHWIISIFFSISSRNTK